MNSELSELKPLYRSRLLFIRELIESYDGIIPFHLYLKNVYSKNKRFGSTDRRIYRSWSYAWFRIGKAVPDLNFYNRLIIAYYLVHGLDDDFSIGVAHNFYGNEFGNDLQTSLDSRIGKVKQLIPEFNLNDIFPFENKLSEGISRDELVLSILKQPNVFIRVLRGKMEIVKEECIETNIEFEVITDPPGCLAFKSSVKLESLPSRDKGYFEIQDMSSQLAGNAIPAEADEIWWDCCSGAGGKSLLLLDKIKGIHITATDKRESVLDNFSDRLRKNNQYIVESMVFDFRNPMPKSISEKQFDGILADVPCSGSGTWSRTSEKLSFFNTDQLKQYNEEQKLIVSKAVSCLKNGGKLAYLTCSVFREENEEISKFISALDGMKLIESRLISGMARGSDSMFCALFKKEV